MDDGSEGAKRDPNNRNDGDPAVEEAKWWISINWEQRRVCQPGGLSSNVKRRRLKDKTGTGKCTYWKAKEIDT